MGKILIADGTEGFHIQLRAMMSAEHTITCATDGVQAWDLFQRMQPDLIVIDLELPQIDGITLLRWITSAGFRPAVIVMARFISDYAVDTLMQMKVGYLMRKPCNVQVVAEQIEELLRYRLLDESPVQTAIREILRDFGIPCDLDGGKYLLPAIMLMAQNPSQYMTKELYPTVGKMYGKTGAQIERSIRNAIEKGWLHGNPSIWKHCFGTEEDGLVKRPNNGVFINKMVELLRTKL